MKATPELQANGWPVMECGAPRWPTRHGSIGSTLVGFKKKAAEHILLAKRTTRAGFAALLLVAALGHSESTPTTCCFLHRHLAHVFTLVIARLDHTVGSLG